MKSSDSGLSIMAVGLGQGCVCCRECRNSTAGACVRMVGRKGSPVSTCTGEREREKERGREREGEGGGDRERNLDARGEQASSARGDLAWG